MRAHSEGVSVAVAAAADSTPLLTGGIAKKVGGKSGQGRLHTLSPLSDNNEAANEVVVWLWPLARPRRTEEDHQRHRQSRPPYSRRRRTGGRSERSAGTNVCERLRACLHKEITYRERREPSMPPMLCNPRM